MKNNKLNHRASILHKKLFQALAPTFLDIIDEGSQAGEGKVNIGIVSN